MRSQSITADPRYAYQAMAECMLRLHGLLTPEAECGITDALIARVYRDSATEAKDPTVRGEYDNGWNLGRWIKIDKRPQPQGSFSHAYARELYAEYQAANRR